MKSFFPIIVILTLLTTVSLYAQKTDARKPRPLPVRLPVDSVITPPPSSLMPDSTRLHIDTSMHAHADSTVVDSVRIRFIPGMGTLSRSVDTTNVLHRDEFMWSDAKYPGDLFWNVPGFFLRDLGEDGSWNQLNAYGLDERNIEILLDGRPMNDPVTGAYNLSDLPLEFIDHTELFAGSSAGSASSRAAGTALNFVSRSYNSYHPMTKLRYVQDPDETLLTDGLFSQNVARGVNLTFGFLRRASDGRYTNAALDAWSLRTRLRWDLSGLVNVALTHLYTKSSLGLNGGVDQAATAATTGATIFDETNASVVSEHAWDSRARHDLTFAALGRLLPDSSSTTHASIYYSKLDREYGNPDFHIDDSTRASFWGVRVQQRVSIDPAYISFGAQWERRQTDSTRTLHVHREEEKSVFANGEARLLESITPSAFIRSTVVDGTSSLACGGGILASPADWLSLHADASWYDRFPTMQERYWQDSTILRSAPIQREQHAFFQAGFTVKMNTFLRVDLSGFRRAIGHAIAFLPSSTGFGSPAITIANIGDVKAWGGTGAAELRWQHFEVRGVLTVARYQERDTIKKQMPDVIFASEVTYRNKFFDNHLDAKFGARSKFNNRQDGMQFDPQTLSFMDNQATLLGRSTTFDLFMILHIGDAYISVSWDNIANTRYMLAPIYPLKGRHFRIGVNWLFLD